MWPNKKKNILKSEVYASPYSGNNKMNAVTIIERQENTIKTDRRASADLKKPERVVAGNLEGLEGGQLKGWVVDSYDKKGVHFQIYDGNKLVIEEYATIYRSDLLDAGYEVGAFGFSVDVPDVLKNGLEHKLLLKLKEHDEVLSSIDVLVESYGKARIHAIEGGTVRGVVNINGKMVDESYEIELLANGAVVAESICAQQNTKNEYLYHIGIPHKFFDDNVYAFSVRLKHYLTESEVYIETIPSLITPWEYINEDACGRKRSALSKVSAYRYASLQKKMSSFSLLEDCKDEIDNTNLAHEIVVEGYVDRTVYRKLKLPKHKNPKVSIVIPVHDNFALTYHCIASQILSSNEVEYEVIVVNDKSTDNSYKLKELVDNLVYVENDVNLGFLLSSSRGAEAAKGEYIVFLNNDTEVTSCWLDEMMNVFNEFNEVGAVGSKLIYPNGKLQEAGGIVWGSGKPWNIGNSENAEHPRYNYTRQVDYLSGAALMISAKVWKEVGGFSPEFIPAYYEDTDLAFKVRDAGYKTFYCPHSTVIHFEGMSNGRDTNAGVKRFQSVNAPTFRAKWRHAYKYGGSEGQNLSLQMDRNVDFRALVIDYATPRPDQDAGSYAAIQEISLLQELGCKVTFIPNNLAYMGKYTEDLQRRGVECVYAPFYQSIKSFLEQRGDEYDVAYITRYDIAEQTIKDIRLHSTAKIIFNNADLHFLRELRTALAVGEQSLDIPIQTRERELQVMRDVDAVLSYNETEHSVITSHNLSDKNIFKCPWVLKSRKSLVPFEQRSGIAFLGGFGHPPNREAVKYFVKSVMPLLRRRYPDISLDVYGSKVTKDIEELACEDVFIRGYVESLSDVFDKCKVFVAPLLAGAGIKGKVLESIAHAIPTVLSPVAAESTGLLHDHSTLIAESDELWCDAIGELYYDEEKWKSISCNAHKLVFTEYSEEKGLKRMSDVFSFIELEPAGTRPKYFANDPR